MSQVLASTTLEGLWNFLTSTTLKQIMIMRWLYIIQRKFSDFISFASAMKKINRRFVFFTIFAIVGMSILNAIGPMPFDVTTLIPVGRWESMIILQVWPLMMILTEVVLGKAWLRGLSNTGRKNKKTCPQQHHFIKELIYIIQDENYSHIISKEI